ncbi:uncharacterized protein C8Q71DRAFT_849042 [Rhodofomes roseus]|uniref:Fungal-type protein kinase domain-containing protein n=1 Tax=Rhodofomes roseus TaxID=34475 RepID=A0ABQ8KCT5_9APHY|nr:uncharacterized protein C8Q71DRAFT_849042 [Rhodofomes roseus]KAH9835411.1 hypothetical protein C8Q71DRAFT_849042 [Rhodofomes roseus]
MAQRGGRAMHGHALLASTPSPGSALDVHVGQEQKRHPAHVVTLPGRNVAAGTGEAGRCRAAQWPPPTRSDLAPVLLIDWDLCKLMKYLGIASRPARSGTWQFMSARLLQNPGKKHEVADDIESFIHVFNWMCLRFVKHNLTWKPRLLQMHVVHMYEEQETMVDGEKNKEEIGGEAKATQMLYGALAVELTDPETPLGELLDELASLCREHYLTFKPKPKRKVKPLAAPSDERLRQKMLD